MGLIDGRRMAAVMAGGLLLASPAGVLGADELRVALIEIEGTPLEQPDPMAWLFGSEKPTLRQLTSTLEDAAGRRDIDSVVLRLKDATLGRTQVEELAGAIARVREAGKTVSVFSYGYDATGLLLGAAADDVLIQTGGGVMFPGLFMQEMFLGDTLRWVGLEPQFVQIGDYKGANEMFMNAEPSEAWNQNVDQLLDGLYGQMREEMREGRDLTDEELDEAMRRAWMADAETAIEVGLVDAAVDLPTLEDYLAGRNGGGGEVEWITDMVAKGPGLEIDPNNPFAAFEMINTLMNPPKYRPKGPTIAVLHVSGPIVDGDSTPGGLMGGAQVGSRTIRNALEDILAEDDIKGVIVRIDSPGGSAIASDVIWQGLRRVAEKKPVWASVGSMAASGGYYVAVGTDKIYVNPSSIVGSIGVVGGKVSPAALMSKLRINTVGRARGPMAGMFSMDPWTSEQLEAVRRKMTETYELFVDRVRAGRPGIDPDKTAEGRLFVGEKAIGLRMADEVGGLDDAVEAMAGELGMRDYDVMDYPAPKSFSEILEEAFGGFVSSPRVGAELAGPAAAVRELVGPEAWPAVRDNIEGLMELRNEPVLLMVPRAIVVN